MLSLSLGYIVNLHSDITLHLSKQRIQQYHAGQNKVNSILFFLFIDQLLPMMNSKYYCCSKNLFGANSQEPVHQWSISS